MAGINADISVLFPVTVEGGVVELVEKFQYFGSTAMMEGVEWSGWLVKAATIFEYLHQSIYFC